MLVTDRTVTYVDDVSSTSPGLLHRMRNNDAIAWTRFTHLYSPLVIGWCQRYNIRTSDIADVVQEVFLAASRGLGSFQHTPGNRGFRAWLRRITYNEAMNYYRQQNPKENPAGGSENQRAIEKIPCAEWTDPEEQLDLENEAAEELLLLRRMFDTALDKLQPKTRNVFWALVIERRPAQEIAVEFELETSAVYSIKSRVLRKVREEYADLVTI
jgi:RNA polymerase sigma-70 factor (ECF subfamily)